MVNKGTYGLATYSVKHDFLATYCSFCVILNSSKVRHSRPGRRYN